MSAILSLKWLPKKPAGKPETAVFFSEKPETAGFPKSQDCPQPTAHPINGPKQLLMGYLGKLSSSIPSTKTGAMLLTSAPDCEELRDFLHRVGSMLQVCVVVFNKKSQRRTSSLRGGGQMQS